MLTLPATWTAADVLVGLVVGTNDGSRPGFVGPQPSSDPSCLTLGVGRIPVPTPSPLVPVTPVPTIAPTIPPTSPPVLIRP